MMKKEGKKRKPIDTDKLKSQGVGSSSKLKNVKG